MSFKKLGRPPEDRLARQGEIYQSVSPLILEQGVQALSMRQAADISCLSIGGLYHYFPTKRDLVLHGLQVETLSRLCQDFHQHSFHLISINLRQFFDFFYHYLINSILFLRPSALATIELETDAFARLYQTLDIVMVEFIKTFRLLAPTLPDVHVQTLARAVRRFCLATLIDATSTQEELRREFYLLIGGSLDREGTFLEVSPFLLGNILPTLDEAKKSSAEDQ